MASGHVSGETEVGAEGDGEWVELTASSHIGSVDGSNMKPQQFPLAPFSSLLSTGLKSVSQGFPINHPFRYKARRAHKRLYTVLPKYSKIQVLPGITSCRLVKDNKQAIELNSLLLNNMPKDGYG